MWNFGNILKKKDTGKPGMSRDFEDGK